MNAPVIKPWPTDLRFDRAKRRLHASFDDGATFDIPFELLRVESPSAENKGHGGATVPPPVKGKANVSVLRAEPVGRYAVRIVFDDGHDSGLYSWDLIYDLGQNRDQRFADYRARLLARETHPDA